MRGFGSHKALEARRLRGLEMLESGMPAAEIAKRLGVTRRSVEHWRLLHEREGIEGLLAPQLPGRPWKLSAESRDKLKALVLRGPRENGYISEIWTCELVAQLIRKRFRVRYHRDHVRKLLRSMGFTPQKPERRARERDEEAIRGWIHGDWARIKKKPGGSGRRSSSSTRAGS